MKKVLLFEANAHHYVVLPGFAYYLTELGYQVDCLFQEHIAYGDEFCQTPSLKQKIRYIPYKAGELPELFERLTKSDTYDFSFCTSLDYIHNGQVESIYSILQEHDHSRFGMIGCYHALESYMINKDDGFDRNRIMCLTEVKSGDVCFPMVNSYYLCDNVEIKERNEKLRVVSIGVSNDNNESRKALETMYQKTGRTCALTFIGGKSGKELHKSQLKKKLMFPLIRTLGIKKYDNEGYAPFPKVSRNVEESITVLGQVRFEQMFEQIQESDFILINIADRFANDFSKNKTTGSRLLVLGFCKPCIIEKKFADYYGFTQKNSIIYEHGKLAEAIEYAASISSSEYASMQRNLFELQQEIRNESMENLKRIIGYIQNAASDGKGRVK